ncbi:MAG: hypothetical protein ABGW69_03900 [Nanoarchaeota archaeon]
MDINGIITTLRYNGFIDYFIVFLLVFTAVYYLFLQVPLLSKDSTRKKLAMIVALASAFIFISNDNYIKALKTTVMDYSYIVIMVVMIALVVTSILYIGEKYEEGGENN